MLESVDRLGDHMFEEVGLQILHDYAALIFLRRSVSYLGCLPSPASQELRKSLLQFLSSGLHLSHHYVQMSVARILAYEGFGNVS